MQESNTESSGPIEEYDTPHNQKSYSRQSRPSVEPTSYRALISELNESPVFWALWASTSASAYVLIEEPLRQVYTSAVLRPIFRGTTTSVRSRVGVDEVRFLSSALRICFAKPASWAAGLAVDGFCDFATSKTNDVCSVVVDDLLKVSEPIDIDVESERTRVRFWVSRILAAALAGFLTYPLLNFRIHWATNTFSSKGSWIAGLFTGSGGFYRALLPSLVPGILTVVEGEASTLLLWEWQSISQASTMSLEEMERSSRRREKWSEDARNWIDSSAVSAITSILWTLLAAPALTVTIHCISKTNDYTSMTDAVAKIYAAEGIWGFYHAVVPLYLWYLVPELIHDPLAIFLTPVKQHLRDLFGTQKSN